MNDAELGTRRCKAQVLDSEKVSEYGCLHAVELSNSKRLEESLISRTSSIGLSRRLMVSPCMWYRDREQVVSERIVDIINPGWEWRLLRQMMYC